VELELTRPSAAGLESELSRYQTHTHLGRYLLAKNIISEAVVPVTFMMYAREFKVTIT
jgi:hypothetical protein